MSINYIMGAIFSTILLFSSIILLFGGGDAFLSALISSGKSGIDTAVTLFCIYAVWMGLSSVAKDSGITKKLSLFLAPVCKKIFKTDDSCAIEDVSMNVASNLLGIGGASTPFAVSAIERFDKLGNHHAQKLLFVVNAMGLQIFPTTVIALRASFNSNSAGDVFLPALICSLFSSAVALTLYFLFEKLCRR